MDYGMGGSVPQLHRQAGLRELPHSDDVIQELRQKGACFHLQNMRLFVFNPLHSCTKQEAIEPHKLSFPLFFPHRATFLVFLVISSKKIFIFAAKRDKKNDQLNL
jgi:hypothetical protein